MRPVLSADKNQVMLAMPVYREPGIRPTGMS